MLSTLLRASSRSPFVVASHSRSLSAAATPSPNYSIYLSKSTNPYFNLTFEDWLFRHSPPDKPLLLIYRDDPCVVIGRNQNPWKEVNFSALRRTGIPFIRRRSGGGTVYHDLGNTNFSIHLPRTSFDRHATAQVVLRAVRSLGIDANVNERNDLCVGKDKMTYKIVNKRAYHHGTMLIGTKLDTLGDLLRTDKETMITRGVASVRSPVCNLQQYSPSASHDAFADAVVQAFREEYNIEQDVQMAEENEATLGIDYVRKGMEELHSWDWAFGQTPEFTYTIKQAFSWGEVTAEVQSKHGVILSCTMSTDQAAVRNDLAALGRSLEGKNYGFAGHSEVEMMSEGEEVWSWLKAAMRT
ncbi:Lipoyltransferase and lipoate-protein ligase [Athelia psychrophila]|uniref:Putative lipoate-protein ligase A n=1 Tax=Athelia psychrophila TaxID=1759441 RepID=A0A166K5F2_9AGAM|nr:Lipoyltransferase and lipoate-protein ligase [Fibularhizoctonia sp. CBS 109695]